ncbi:GNAT family N-acetyltransferase [Streptomyces sp. NPDC057027]|uniref:GNAT family N-acetyltransferase n=1 Tax=Streptomyces sp. NPDC057027 TaxID=3346004 RepID=UPI00362B478D
MAVLVQSVSGSRLLAYADVFGALPWGEGPERADASLRRLGNDVDRPGFTAALERDGDVVVGWATAWTTPSPFPTGRCYPPISAALGKRRTADRPCGAREVDELAVATPARGAGLGARLLDAVTADRADGRCWLLTSVAAITAVAFYEREGWTQATHPAPGGAGHAAFLGPRHLARTAAPRPLLPLLRSSETFEFRCRASDPRGRRHR